MSLPAAGRSRRRISTFEVCPPVHRRQPLFADLRSLIYFFANLRALSSSANIVMSQFFFAHTHAKLSRLAKSRATSRRRNHRGPTAHSRRSRHRQNSRYHFSHGQSYFAWRSCRIHSRSYIYQQSRRGNAESRLRSPHARRSSTGTPVALHISFLVRPLAASRSRLRRSPVKLFHLRR